MFFELKSYSPEDWSSLSAAGFGMQAWPCQARDCGCVGRSGWEKEEKRESYPDCFFFFLHSLGRRKSRCSSIQQTTISPKWWPFSPPVCQPRQRERERKKKRKLIRFVCLGLDWLHWRSERSSNLLRELARIRNSVPRCGKSDIFRCFVSRVLIFVCLQPFMTGEEQRQFVGNDKVRKWRKRECVLFLLFSFFLLQSLLIVADYGVSVSPRFRGNVNSCAVVLQRLDAAQCEHYDRAHLEQWGCPAELFGRWTTDLFFDSYDWKLIDEILSLFFCDWNWAVFLCSCSADSPCGFRLAVFSRRRVTGFVPLVTTSLVRDELLLRDLVMVNVINASAATMRR